MRGHLWRWHIKSFMTVTSLVYSRYVIHLFDMTVTSVWENKSIYIYYTELGFELSALAVDFTHHLHMLVRPNKINQINNSCITCHIFIAHIRHRPLSVNWYLFQLWGNIFLSMASLVICMQLKYLFYEFKRRINRHKNYRKVVQNMEAR
jgi:autocrine motility factor receptor